MKKLLFLLLVAFAFNSCEDIALSKSIPDELDTQWHHIKVFVVANGDGPIPSQVDAYLEANPSYVVDAMAISVGKGHAKRAIVCFSDTSDPATTACGPQDNIL